MNNIINQLREYIRVAPSRYYQLILLVGESQTGKTKLLQYIAEEKETDVINLNLALSSRLLELSIKERVISIQMLLRRIVERYDDLIFFDNIELLFNNSLGQDPLFLLKQISRYRPVVSSWYGKISGQKLIHADVGHKDYRTYEASDIFWIDISTVNEEVKL